MVLIVLTLTSLIEESMNTTYMIGLRIDIFLSFRDWSSLSDEWDLIVSFTYNGDAHVNEVMVEIPLLMYT